MADTKGVLVVSEVHEGKLAAITTELLGIGRKLADELGLLMIILEPQERLELVWEKDLLLSLRTIRCIIHIN